MKLKVYRLALSAASLAVFLETVGAGRKWG